MTETITIDEVENTTQVNPADAALMRCKSYTFLGKKLHPMTKMRALSAAYLGIMGFGSDFPKDENGNTDDGAVVQNVTLLIWLLSVDETVARAAGLNRKKAIANAMDWWIENVPLGSKYMVEAGEIFSQIITDHAVCHVEVDSSGTSAGNSNLGE